MAIAIRLARGGMKKRPFYRIVVTDSRQPRDGRFLEKIGTYNPLLPKESPERIKLDGERAAYWLGVGAQPSDRVARFLDAMGLRTRAARLNAKKGEPGANAKERAEVKATKASEAIEAQEAAKAAAAEAAAAAAAAPAPEPEVEAAPEVETAVELPSDSEPVVDSSAAETETPVEGDAPAGDATLDAAASDATLDATTETDASPAGPAV